MNTRNLFGMDCIKRLLSFSISCPSDSPRGVLLLPHDPFFLYVISAPWTPSCCGHRTGTWWFDWSSWSFFRLKNSYSSFTWLHHVFVRVTVRVARQLFFRRKSNRNKRISKCERQRRIWKRRCCLRRKWKLKLFSVYRYEEKLFK